jgi:hypothetical protein
MSDGSALIFDRFDNLFTNTEPEKDHTLYLIFNIMFILIHTNSSNIESIADNRINDLSISER